jgi:hypothetical protein
VVGERHAERLGVRVGARRDRLAVVRVLVHHHELEVGRLLAELRREHLGSELQRLLGLLRRGRVDAVDARVAAVGDARRDRAELDEAVPGAREDLARRGRQRRAVGAKAELDVVVEDEAPGLGGRGVHVGHVGEHDFDALAGDAAAFVAVGDRHLDALPRGLTEERVRARHRHHDAEAEHLLGRAGRRAGRERAARRDRHGGRTAEAEQASPVETCMQWIHLNSVVLRSWPRSARARGRVQIRRRSSRRRR